jgi:phage gp45-like
MLADETRRHVGRYYGKYHGTVVDNADPEHRGLLEVQVPDVFGAGVVVTAEACLPYGYASLPPNGSGVYCEFEAGDPERPLWVAVAHTKANQTKVKPDAVTLSHTGDAFISIDDAGSVLVSSPSKSYVHLDAANKSATVAEGHGNFVSLGEQGVSIVNNDGTVVNVTKDTVHIRAAKVVVEATSVALGAGATDTTVLGTGMEMLWGLLQAHVHEGLGLTPAATLKAIPKLIPGVHLSSAVVVK